MRLFGRPRAPLRSLVFEIEGRCSLDCRYCYNTWKMPGAEAPPPTTHAQATRTLRRLFRQVALQHITITGGEPFLFDRIAEIVLACRLKGCSVTLISNGTVARPDAFRQMVDLGVGLFELPLLSPSPEIHDALVRRPGSWERVHASIAALQALDAALCLVVVVSRPNHAVLGETLHHIADLGVKRVLLNRFNVGGAGIGESDALSLSAEQIREIFVTAEAVAVEREMRITSGVCSPLCVVDQADFPRVRPVTCSPDPQRRPLTLTPTGDLRSCNHSPVVLGNIFEQHIADIMAGEAMRAWAETVPELCRDCARWAECLGGCRAASEQLGRGLESPDPILW